MTPRLATEAVRWTAHARSVVLYEISERVIVERSIDLPVTLQEIVWEPNDHLFASPVNLVMPMTKSEL